MTRINLQARGLRKTYPRLKVLEALESSPGAHLSAEEIFTWLDQKNAGLALSTIYRVLAQLAEIGILRKHQFGDGTHTKFEIETGKQHDHLICAQCGRILEFHAPKLMELHSGIARHYGFDLYQHTLTLYGYCKDPQCSYAQ